MKTTILTLLMIVSVLFAPVNASASGHDDSSDKALNPKEIIFEHLGDGYGWEVPFNHHKRIPLPVILFGKDGVHCFMSSKISDGKEYKDGDAVFKIAGHDSKYKGKVEQVMPDGSE